MIWKERTPSTSAVKLKSDLAIVTLTISEPLIQAPTPSAEDADKNPSKPTSAQEAEVAVA